ncbi:MAG: glycosyltransferase family 2 protein [Candidatus Hydrogenedentes bacterium]|nr:glycosyltransferase family 2 protein [Candidatus Hydrogenedentota bacterium]
MIIINWNGIEHLNDCFTSLLACEYPHVRFVLVDNGSTDGSVEYVRREFGVDPRVEIVELGENLGWSPGNNAGIERALEADADYIFLLNNDTWTAPDAVGKLVEFADANPNAGAIAPKMLMFYQPDLLNSVGVTCSMVGVGWDEGLGRVDTPAWNMSKPVLGVCGGAMFLRSSSLRKTGLLPTDFEIYLDDLDLSLRMWSAGYEVWSCPEAVVRHKFSATMGEGERAKRKYYLNTRNRLRLILRNFPASKSAAIAAAYIMSECKALGRALLNGEGWRIKAHVRSWFDALAYLGKAAKARKALRATGFNPMRFWPMVQKRQLFFPGTEFPEEGWYAPRTLKGVFRVRPMTQRATLAVEGGPLRILLTNCYPRVAEAHVRVAQNDCQLAHLSTSSLEEVVIETRPGTLEFYAERLFTAEETGEQIDIGGWIAVEPLRADTHPPEARLPNESV